MCVYRHAKILRDLLGIFGENELLMFSNMLVFQKQIDTKINKILLKVSD